MKTFPNKITINFAQPNAKLEIPIYFPSILGSQNQIQAGEQLLGRFSQREGTAIQTAVVLFQ